MKTRVDLVPFTSPKSVSIDPDTSVLHFADDGQLRKTENIFANFIVDKAKRLRPKCLNLIYMYRHLVLLFISFCFIFNSVAQCDTSFPITVTLKLEKEYNLTVPRSHYSPQLATGEINIASDSVTEAQYDVTISLKNVSANPTYIWLMSCSWFENFQINNNYMHIHGSECDKNIPELVRFSPGETKIFNLTLSKSVKFEHPCSNCIYGPQVESTKLGLIVIDDVYRPKLHGVFAYTFAIEDKSVWKIIWSNPLYLLTKKEVSANRPRQHVP